MRKESIGRLLLTLLTAFIMVAGAFVVAIPNSNTTEVTPDNSLIAARELGKQKSVTGEAPVSAIDAANNANPTATDPYSVYTDTNGIQVVTKQAMEMENKEKTTRTYSKTESSRMDYGTRAPTLDPNGPYGTMDDPYFEGSPVDFHATLNNPDPGMTYQFRWDVTGDGSWDTPGTGGWQSSTDFSWTFDDNNIGKATVQAWDGTYTTITSYGQYWQNDDVNVGLYSYGGYYVWGWGFTVAEDITVTELGGFRGEIDWYMNAHWPETQYESIRLWDSSATQLAAVYDVAPALNTWGWVPITPITLSAGETYFLSSYVEAYNYPDYYTPADYNPGPSPDGMINPLGAYYYYGGGDTFPWWTYTTSYVIKIDLKYEVVQMVPNIIEAKTDVWVDNVAPTPLFVDFTPEVGQEGIPVTFSGSFYDPGTGDSWQYRWIFGDGTDSGWMPVRKIGGTAKVLFLHSWQMDYYGGEIMDDLTLRLGAFAEVLDTYDCGPMGEMAAPELDYLLEYDVVLISFDYYIFDAVLTGALGDVLADYSDLGGGVVQLTFAAGDQYYSQVAGRWMAQRYNPLAYASNHYGNVNMGTVYEPTHMIMDGVSTMGAYYKHNAMSVTPGATLVANYQNGIRLCAYTNEDHHISGGGRVVGLNTFAWPSYVFGDGMQMIANAVMWASNKAFYYPMPIPLDPVEHIYVDDHPSSITPADWYNAKLEIRDDDHLRTVVLGDPTIVDFVDFQGGSAWPTGWWEGGAGGWQLVSPGNGLSTRVAQHPYWYYGTTSTLNSPSYDLSGSTSGDMTIDWDNYWWADWAGGSQDGYVEISIDGGMTWDIIQEFHHNNPSLETRHYTAPYPAALGQPDVRLRFRCYMYDDWFWEVDNIRVMVANFHTMSGMGEGPDMPILVENVFPQAVSPPGFELIRPEANVVLFEGFEITDPALKQPTESFWYKINYDDGIETSWLPTQGLMPGYGTGGWVFVTGIPMDFPCAYGYSQTGAQQLMANMLDIALGFDGDILYQDESWFGSAAIMTAMQNTLNANFGRDYTWYYGTGTQTLLDVNGYPTYDLIYFGYDWAYNSVYMGGSFPYTATEIADYVAAGGHLIIPGDEFGAGVLSWLPWYVQFPTAMFADFYSNFPGPAFTGWVVDDIAKDVQTGDWGFDYELHNDIHDFDPTEFIAVFADPDPFTTIVHVGERRYPKQAILPFEHEFGDNGIYYVDVQVIDDDMYWDLSSGFPVYVGPAGEENDWVSHNVFPVEVNNIDPVITRKIKAYGDLDLSLRMSGAKRNSATMRLYENNMLVGEVTVERDPGAPNIGVLPATLQVTEGFEYRLEIEYNPDDLSGADPTWIFEGHFPDGKIKELKHTFNSNDPTDRIWVIPNLQKILLGHDIIFEAEAVDLGTDDLAFLWNFGDSTPHGVHIYANSNPTLMVDGFSAKAPFIFDQNPARDPWFEKAPNTERSPFGTGIYVRDTITHVFDEDQPYFYYVALTVIDDDVGDGYPSPYLNGGGYDMEFAAIDLS